MQVSKVDAIISAWQKEGEILRYSQIKQHLVKKQVIGEKNDRTLSRWLKKLTEDGTLKKTQKGYALKMTPKQFQMFDYINELRQKFGNYIYEGEVGGLISHVCAMNYLNFDDTLLQENDEKIAFNIISLRLAELFSALHLLRNTILKRRIGLTQIDLDDTTVREIFFGLLVRSIGRPNATEDLFTRYFRLFRRWEKEAFRKVWKRNSPKITGGLFSNELLDFFLDDIHDDGKNIKKQLKKRSGIDVDKYQIEELVEKYIDIQNWITRSHEKDLVEKHWYGLTQEESELEGDYRTAIMLKVIEGLKALNTNFEDFAVILTRHPKTMDQYYTAEHILYNAMQWAKEPPEDEFLKEMWIEDKENEKTFEGMVAEQLITTGRHSVEKYSKLKSKPWVIHELRKLGDFNLILELYSKKLEEYFKKLEKERSELLENHF